jgi:hypothetical protein
MEAVVLHSDLSMIFPRCHHLLQVYIWKAYCCCLRLVAFLRGHHPSEVSVWKKVYCLEPVLFLDLLMIAVMVMSMVVVVEHLKVVMYEVFV